jgi:N-methylhydantoinase A
VLFVRERDVDARSLCVLHLSGEHGIRTPAEAAAVDRTQAAAAVTPYVAHAVGRRSLLDPAGETIEASMHRRADLRPGARIPGPAIITEDETSTVVGASFEAVVNGFGYIELRRRG